MAQLNKYYIYYTLIVTGKPENNVLIQVDFEQDVMILLRTWSNVVC